jgi:hypothetical protein
MTEALRAGRTAIVAGVLLAGLPLAGPARAAGEPSLPAVLDGDPALVAQVGDALAGRGVATAASAPGEAVRVQLTSGTNGISLALRDQHGRAAERTVATAETAAALIESWTRQGIAEPLLRHPPAVTPAPVMETVVPVAEARWTPSFRLSGETAFGLDRSLSMGVSAGACLRLGPLCLGAAGRFARDLGESEARLERGLLARPRPSADLEALGTVELPIPLGQATLVLGVGAGMGWGSDGEREGAGLRTEARAALAVPMGPRLSLELGIAAAMAPGPRPPALAGEAVALPDGQLRFGLGVRWGL